jgi:AGCS family alanine or glycine:cation symporter
LKLNAIGNSGELIQLGAEGATPWLKNVKAESLRQRDGDTPAQRRFFRHLPILLCFFSCRSFVLIGSFSFSLFFFNTEENIMATITEASFLSAVQTINEYLSNYVLVFLLLGVGIWYTIKTKFVQIRCFKEGWNRVFGNISLNGKKGGGGMSSFQALATAIAAQVGTGIIVGVAGAILTGGPGAVFWMWVISFFGMATIYAEATLAQETRVVGEDGSIKGGPVYYITAVFKGRFGKFLAGFFATAIILALGFMGCMVQSNSIGATMETAFGIQSWVVGLVLVAICAFIFLGGVQRLASVTEKVVPLMAAVFLFGGLIVLAVRIKYIPETFALIFRYAFEPQAIIGGGFGYAIKLAISQGAKRGLFSNEAGMGSTPHAHALANVKNPHEQGTVAIIGVFIDMFVILTLNALVIISTLYAGNGPLSGRGAAALSSTFNKTNLAQCAFGTVFGYKAGSMFVAVCLFFFAFSTILSWNLFGKINMTYLFGERSNGAYTCLALIFIFLGTTMSNDLVWELSDMFNQLMVIPNAIALLALTSHVVRHSHTPDRLSDRKGGK